MINVKNIINIQQQNYCNEKRKRLCRKIHVYCVKYTSEPPPPKKPTVRN